MSGAPSHVPVTAGPRSYRELRVWHAAVALTVEAYRLTETFPPSERFGLTTQIRRAAISVISNIAEGHGRSSFRAYAHHLAIARGSTREVEAQFLIAERLGFTHQADLQHLWDSCDALSRMLQRLRWSIERHISPTPDRRPPTIRSG